MNKLSIALFVQFTMGLNVQMVPEIEQTEIVYGKRNQNPFKIKTVTELLVSLNSTQISYSFPRDNINIHTLFALQNAQDI